MVPHEGSSIKFSIDQGSSSDGMCFRSVLRHTSNRRALRLPPFYKIFISIIGHGILVEELIIPELGLIDIRLTSKLEAGQLVGGNLLITAGSLPRLTPKFCFGITRSLIRGFDTVALPYAMRQCRYRHCCLSIECLTSH